MLNTDKSFDILPYVVDIYEKIEADKYIEETRKKYKKNPVSKENQSEIKVKAGIDLFKYVLRNAAKVKKEIITIVSILNEKTVEEVAAQNFAQTIMEVKNLLTDKETMDFFKTAMH